MKPSDSRNREDLHLTVWKAVLLPEANPRMTIAISQQKRRRSPKIIYRKQRRRKMGRLFLHASEQLLPADLSAPVLPPARL